MARASWHNWELGVQFYDDALDLEEDYRDSNSSWAVSRTLEIFRSQLNPGDTSALPDQDDFYKVALTEGVVCQALTYAERFFAASARKAEQAFPTWAAFQSQCVSRTVSLREDYEKMIAAPGHPIPFLRKGSRDELRAATGDEKLPALRLADGTVLTHSRAILAWAAGQG